MKTERNPSGNWSIIVVVIIGLALFFALLFFARRAAPLPDNEMTVDNQSQQIAGANNRVVSVGVYEEDPVLGVSYAPVTIIEYSDFACSFCGQFHLDTLPQIQERFIDPGIVRYVFKDFPLTQIHPDAYTAAGAAHCAQDQDKFWEYAKILFEHPDAQAPENLAAYALELNLNLGGFKDCIDASKKVNVIDHNMKEAAKSGITTTPSFVVNGVLYEGALSFSEIEQAIIVAINPSR